MRRKLECLRCGHKWWPRAERLPQTCPNRDCHSPYWHTPRREPEPIPERLKTVPGEETGLMGTGECPSWLKDA